MMVASLIIQSGAAASGTSARAALAQSTSFCTAGAPLTPIAPTISPFTLMGNPPPHAATRVSVGIPAKSDGSLWIKLKKSCVETPNRAVYALFCAISMVGIEAPSIRLKALRLPPSSRIATFSATPSSLAFATAAFTIFCASSEEMLYLFTTLAIGFAPLDMCCALITFTSHSNDDLSELAVVLQIAMNFHHVVELECAIDDRHERRREVLHQRVDRALRGRIGRQGADGGVCPEGRDENDAAALAEHGKQLLHQEIRRADVDCEELIEILDRHFLDGRSFRDPCIGDKDVQAISDDAACLLGKLAGAIRGGKVHRYGIRAATGFAYLCDNTVGFFRAAAVMHENLGAGGGKRDCAGASYAARTAGNESGFAGQSSHDHRPGCCYRLTALEFTRTDARAPTGTSRHDGRRVRDT